MMFEYTGRIQPFDEQIQVNNENYNLGVCWIGKHPQKNLDQTLTVHSEERELIIPGKDRYLISRVRDMILSAQDTIVLSSFLLERGELTDVLLEKAKQNVSVFVLTARSEDVDIKNDDDLLSENKQKTIEKHKQLLDLFAGCILIRTANYFHAKYLLCDPRSASATGILMTCNATVDPMTGHNPEIAVTLRPGEIKSLFSHFLHGFWKEANHELITAGKLSAVIHPTEIENIINYGTTSTPVTMMRTNSLKEFILSGITSAKSHITISAWSFEEDHEVLMALQDKLKTGVSVSVLTRRSDRNTIALRKLRETGAVIYGHERFHAKCLMIDDEEGLIMTANIARKGLETGFEAGLILREKDALGLQRIIQIFIDICDSTLHTDTRILDLSTAPSYKYVHGEQKEIIITESQQLKDKIITSPFDICGRNTIQQAYKPAETSDQKIICAKTAEYVLHFTPAVLPDDSSIVSEGKPDEGIELFVQKNKNGKITNKFVCVDTWEAARLLKKYVDKKYRPVIRNTDIN